MNISEIAYKKLETHEEKMALFNKVADEFPVLQHLFQYPKKMRIREKKDRYIPGSAWPTGNIYINTYWMDNLHEMLFATIHEIGHIIQMQEGRLINEPPVIEDGKMVKPPVFKYRAAGEDEPKVYSKKGVKTPQDYRNLPWEKEVNDLANRILGEMGLKEFDYDTWALRFEDKKDVEYEFSIPNILKRAEAAYKADRSGISIGRSPQGDIIVILRGTTGVGVPGPDGEGGVVQEQEVHT